MTEFVVQMENRPGRLASLTEALAAFGVNIEAIDEPETSLPHLPITGGVLTV